MSWLVSTSTWSGFPAALSITCIFSHFLFYPIYVYLYLVHGELFQKFTLKAIFIFKSHLYLKSHLYQRGKCVDQSTEVWNRLGEPGKISWINCVSVHMIWGMDEFMFLVNWQMSTLLLIGFVFLLCHQINTRYKADIRVTNLASFSFTSSSSSTTASTIYINHDPYHSSATSPNGPRSRSPPVSSIVIIVGRDSTSTCIGIESF